jgi:hypothetical protein
MRTSRNLSVTEAGRDFYESGARLIGDLEAADSRVVAKPIILFAPLEEEPAPGKSSWICAGLQMNVMDSLDAASCSC